jgi:hypothetical protein
MARVFVSSTCHDLVDVRREVEEHLRNMGLQPVLSDRPTSDFEVSPNDDSIQSCLVNVAACPIFVCILSQRYGSKLGAFGHPDRSATHLEYDEATKLGKDIWLYVRDTRHHAHRQPTRRAGGKRRGRISTVTRSAASSSSTPTDSSSSRSSRRTP